MITKNKGITYSRKDKRFVSQLTYKTKIYRKYFDTEAEAIAYRKELEDTFLNN